MAYVKIRPRRSTKAEWEYDNPVLAEGEMGVEVPDTGVGTGYTNIKFGDGTTPWTDLPYAVKGGEGGGGGVDPEIESRVESLENDLADLKEVLVVV